MKTRATGGKYKTVRSERRVFGHGQKHRRGSDSEKRCLCIRSHQIVVTPQESLTSHKKQDIERACVKLRACSDQQKYFTLVYIAWVAMINPEAVIPVD